VSWVRVRLFASAFLIMLAVVAPTAGSAQDATPAVPQPPTQPTTGPGSSEAFFGGVTSIGQAPDAALSDYWIFVPADPLPGTAQAGEPFPLVIFIHGSTVTTPDPYLAWIEHLVRRGAVVLYPLYEVPTEEGPLDYRQTVQDDVQAGLAMLEDESVPVDLTRVAVVGHSLGADQALVYAASAAAADLPVPTAVMSVAPGCFPMRSDGPCYEADLGLIPATTRLLLVTAEHDTGTTGTALIWEELTGVPLENRDVVRLVADGHGRPSLLADHTQALAGGIPYTPDAFDWYGTWKWLDALMGCAFDEEWCEYALGNTPEQRFMGTWTDGIPVAEPLVTDEPA
jgi:acetyl esterase/lipase